MAGGGGEEEEEDTQDGLTDVDYIAIALGLGLTTFIVVSMAVLLYRAEKRRKRAKYMQRWRITVKGRVSSKQLLIDNLNFKSKIRTLYGLYPSPSWEN